MGKALRVLNIEDSERDSVLLARHITAAGYDLIIDRIDTPDGMKAALDAAEWDIIICDYSMPQFNALHALELLRGTGIDIPFVIISGTVGEDTAVQAMLTGAHDYIQKGNLTRLVPAIERELHQARNRREQRQIKNERKAIYEIIQGAISSPDLDEYLKLVHRSVSRIVYAENFIVMLHDSATDVFDYAFWADKFDAQPPPRPVGHGFGSYVLRTGRPLLLTRELKRELVDRGEATLSGTPSLSWIGVPLRTPSRIIGVIVLQHYEIENAYSQRVLEFLSSVADQIALAVERKRAEDTIAVSEGRYRDLVENAIDIIYTHDLKGNYTSVNKAGEQITGYSREEALTLNITSVVAPEYLQEARQMLAAKPESEDGTTYELAIIAKDGHRVMVEVKSRLIYENRVAVGVQGIARDITERKRAEAALEQSEASFKSIFDTANDAILVVDKGMFLACNPAAELLFGCTNEELIGADPDVFSPRDQPDGRLSAEKSGELMKAAMTGTPQNFEWKHNRLDGTTFDAEVSLNRVEFGGNIQLQGTVRDITARKIAEAAMQEKTALLEAQVNSTIDGILVVDGAGNQIIQNQQFVELFKIPQEIAEESDDTKRLKWVTGMIKDPQQFAEKVDHLYSHPDEISRDEIELVDGSLLDRYSAPVIGKDNKHYGRIWSFRDTTEQKRTNLELLESNEKFEQLVDNISDVFWVRSLDMREVIYVSPAFEQIWGRTVESLYAEPHEWIDFVLDEDRARVENAFTGLTQDFGRLDIEYRIVRPDGAVRWVRLRGFPVKNAAGIPFRYAGIVSDITDRKHADVAMRESEERFFGAFEQAPIGVALVSLDGHWLKVNHALTDLVGYSEAELLDTTFQDITHPDDLALDLENMHRLSDGEIASYQIEKRYIHKLGHILSILLDVSLVRTADGQPRYYIAQIQDITSRRHLEEQFRQSQKMEAVGVLAGGIAHDFNNLLTAINGYSTLTLKKMEPDDPFRNNIEEVKKAGDRAAELTGQLLAFSRKQVLNPVVLSLNNVIFNIEKMLRRLISEGVELRVISDPNLGNVKADPGQIEQVIMNLAVNARDAMPNGGTLSLETQNVYLDEAYVSQHNNVSPGQFIRLTITDTGEGMDERTKEHIFEPFYTTKGVGKGTGLGLSIVYGIVKQSGGDILVYSEMGHGTSFKIYLPCVDESVQKSKRPGDREELYFGTETVLLVEDEDIVRTLVREVLTDNGYKVLEAAGGEAALAICESYVQPIHLLLTDIIMPKMGGGDLTDLVTKMRPDICVLFMSGYTDDAVTHRGINNADLAFIEKPFTPDGLARKVREVLGSGRSDTILAADLTT